MKRLSTVTKDDKILRKKMMFTLLQNGIPLAKLDGMRRCIEDVTHHKLASSKDIRTEYLEELLNAEDDLHHERG